MMELQRTIQSKIDKTIKYIYELEGQTIEFSYIDNGTGKDIICVPCQTMCNMSCTFCHLTDHVGKIKLRNLSHYHIVNGVNDIITELDLGGRELLISYMGCGEPLDNWEEVFESMLEIKKLGGLKNLRFGMATMLPKKDWSDFFKLTESVIKTKLNLKIHLSLHFTDNETRLKWMPAAFDVKASVDALNFYNHITGNPTEVHYTIMDGVNDSNKDVQRLEMLMRGSDATIKFMRYSEKESLDVHATAMERIEEIMDEMANEGFNVEYYEPPGLDIGASCGQFLMDDIVKDEAQA